MIVNEEPYLELKDIDCPNSVSFEDHQDNICITVDGTWNGNNIVYIDFEQVKQLIGFLKNCINVNEAT